MATKKKLKRGRPKFTDVETRKSSKMTVSPCHSFSIPLARSIRHPKAASWRCEFPTAAFYPRLSSVACRHAPSNLIRLAHRERVGTWQS